MSRLGTHLPLIWVTQAALKGTSIHAASRKWGGVSPLVLRPSRWVGVLPSSNVQTRILLIVCMSVYSLARNPQSLSPIVLSPPPPPPKYGQQVEYLGPTVASFKLSKDPSTHIVSLSVVYDHADSFHTHGTAACTQCCDQSPFEVGDGVT